MKKNLLTFVACLLVFVAGVMLYSPNSYHISNAYRYECGKCGEAFENAMELPENYEGACPECEEAITFADLTLLGAPENQVTFRYECPSCHGTIEREHEMKASYRGECPLCNEKITGKTAIALKEKVTRSFGYYLAAAGSYMTLGGAVFGLVSGTNFLLDVFEYIGERINYARYSKKSKEDAAEVAN